MNALDIWAGNLYAYKEGKGKGVDAPYGCAKVRAVKVLKRLEAGKQRETAFVVSIIVDPGSHRYLKVGDRLELRARDYVDFWDDYAHRREEIEAESREREAKRQAALEEARRAAEYLRKEQEERLRQQEQEKHKILEQFSRKTRIPMNLLIMNYGSIGVSCNSQEFRDWLLEDTRDV